MFIDRRVLYCEDLLEQRFPVDRKHGGKEKMKTKKEVAELRRELRAVRACDGNCHDCPDLYIHTGAKGNNIFYALSCLRAPSLNAIGESMATLKEEVIGALLWELEVI